MNQESIVDRIKMSMHSYYKDFLIRSWEKDDRIPASEVIRSTLAEYGLGWEADGADRDVMQVEECYLNNGGEFWVVEQENQIVGTAAYYPISRGENAVEIRKMYLLPHVRGLGLGNICYNSWKKLLPPATIEKFGSKLPVSSPKLSNSMKVTVIFLLQGWKLLDAIAFTSKSY
jgi:GNAT superfamily N-acetyltransferase